MHRRVTHHRHRFICRLALSVQTYSLSPRRVSRHQPLQTAFSTTASHDLPRTSTFFASLNASSPITAIDFRLGASTHRRVKVTNRNRQSGSQHEGCSPTISTDSQQPNAQFPSTSIDSRRGRSKCLCIIISNTTIMITLCHPDISEHITHPLHTQSSRRDIDLRRDNTPRPITDTHEG